MHNNAEHPSDQHPSTKNHTNPERGGVQKKIRVRAWMWWACLTMLFFFFAQYFQGFGHRSLSLVFAWLGCLATARALWVQLTNNQASHLKADILAGSIILAGSVPVWWEYHYDHPQETPYSGLLIAPDNRGIPNCVRIFLGTCIVITRKTNSLPLVQFQDEILLSLSVGSTGASISGKFCDRDGKVVALLETNRFTINRFNFLRTSDRGDKSCFAVTDQFGTEVLNIRRINQSDFILAGTLRLPNATQIEITKTNIHYREVNIDHELYKGRGVIRIRNGKLGIGFSPERKRLP